uniref:hypothetical protein n=1 Tax=Hassallia byssoidea TaxID=482630 RepID=UPI001F1B24CC|nr:hypothetical protein [Hassalia byssoidea]
MFFGFSADTCLCLGSFNKLHINDASTKLKFTGNAIASNKSVPRFWNNAKIRAIGRRGEWGSGGGGEGGRGGQGDKGTRGTREIRGMGEMGEMGEYQLPITHYQLPITHYPLPITHYPLPIP